MGVTDERMIRASVIGLGAMGKVHLAAYSTSRHSRVVHVCDIDASACAAAPVGPSVHRSTAVDAVADDPDVEIVSVCLPHRLHVPVAVQLLEAGKAVVLEKPVAVDLEQAASLLEASGRHPGRLVVKSYLRHSAAFLALRSAVIAGAIGTPRLAVAEFATLRRDADVPMWRLDREQSGGGALLDAGLHLIDILHWCFGPESVVAAVSRFDRQGLDLDTAVVLSFDNCGPLATVNVTQRSRESSPYFRLRVFDSTAASLLNRSRIQRSSAPTSGRRRRSSLLMSTGGATLTRAAIHSYVESYSLHGRFGEPPEEAVANLATVVAAYKSCRIEDAALVETSSQRRWVRPRERGQGGVDPRRTP